MKTPFAMLLVSTALAASGCVSLLPEPPPAPRFYPLEASTSVPAQGVVVDAVASVAPPTGPQVLMGDGIVWRSEGTLAYMGGAAWPGRAPDLLQAMLAQTITRQGRLSAGVRAGEGLRGDVEVRWDLIAFEIVEQDGSLEARFAAHVRIVQSRGRALLHSEIVDLSVPLQSRNGASAAAALARAAQEACARIAAMTADAAANLEPAAGER
ncbi:MAG: membrane integrity-associated transporter subunit PqiC [Hydrogenophilaceae bacterium]|jgi:ABC-type uncharacterized transport system auxiliary subunit|nr:membrane integrity-associated transporter subunit PqiC [Hydrogenophilaceae bacterium]